VADRAEPVKVTEELRPGTITLIATDTCMVDLGQNMVGWLRLRMRGPRGARVRLRFGEMLNPDGTLYTENLRRARGRPTPNILHGDGKEIFEPHFTFHGFRYVEVTGYPGTLGPDAIVGCVVGSATPVASLFQCSSALVNRLQRNIVWSQRGNFLSVPTDCPQRDERLGWMGDAQLFARTACFNMDAAAFFTKWLRDVADTQSPDGAFADIAPRLDMPMTTDTGVSDLSSGAPAWGDAGVIVPWTLYQCYGDTRIIEQHYAGMARWLAYIGEGNPDYLRANRRGNDYGDWLALDSGAPSALFESGTPRELLATAFWAYDALLMARMARVIGRDDDAGAYAALFERINSLSEKW